MSKRCPGDGQEPQKNPRLLGERLPRHQIAVVLQNRQQDFIACEEFEGEIGPRVVGNGVHVGTEQQIDIGTFYNEFIRPGRGIANGADGPSARAKVTHLLSMIERNQHADEVRPPPA